LLKCKSGFSKSGEVPETDFLAGSQVILIGWSHLKARGHNVSKAFQNSTEKSGTHSTTQEILTPQVAPNSSTSALRVTPVH
jgi:hypothetical protein